MNERSLKQIFPVELQKIILEKAIIPKNILKFWISFWKNHIEKKKQELNSILEKTELSLASEENYLLLEQRWDANVQLATFKDYMNEVTNRLKTAR